jgi:microcystin-dependent protein
MDPIIGQIIMFVGNFAPEGWAFCWGQELPIAQNQALFAVIGIQFGGNGTSTFKLPDLRGRFPVGSGNGPNLTPRTQGQSGGAESVILTIAQMPAHQHAITNTTTNGLTMSGSGTVKCSSAAGNTASPANAYPSLAKQSAANYTSTATDATASMATDIIQLSGTISGNVTVTSQCQIAGNGQSHENMPPWTCINYIIAVNGIFPTRP